MSIPTPWPLLLAAIAAVAVGFALYHRALRFHAFGYVLLAVGAIVYVAMPRIIFDTYMADQRLPISLAFMVIACAQLDLRRLGLRYGFARHGVVAVLALLLAGRVLEVQTVWTALSPGTASFRESVELIDRGAKVMVAYADPDGGDDVRNLGLVHAACLAIIERSALVTTVFTVVGKQVLHVRADYRDRVDTQDGSPPDARQSGAGGGCGQPAETIIGGAGPRTTIISTCCSPTPVTKIPLPRA